MSKYNKKNPQKVQNKNLHGSTFNSEATNSAQGY